MCRSPTPPGISMTKVGLDFFCMIINYAFLLLHVLKAAAPAPPPSPDGMFLKSLDPSLEADGIWNISNS